MLVESIKFRGHRCFKNGWAGFDAVRPINVIIGRNNSGKSHLLDLVNALCADKPFVNGWYFRCRGTLDENSLKRQFPEDGYHGQLYGNHWSDNGRFFVGIEIEWEVNERKEVAEVFLPESLTHTLPRQERDHEGRMTRIKHVVREGRHQLANSTFRRLFADRDIRPEAASNQLSLASDGSGATNIIRRYLVSSSSKLPRQLIQTELLEALNQIFSGDGNFTEIEVKNHDESESGHPLQTWEVFLGEAKKGLVSLSRSGSGLKTILLVLLNLLVIPEIEGRAKKSYVFAFEELENNLHPALLRRLFHYLETYAVRQKSAIFLTTHSSTALDIFGLSENAQILHVRHDGESASVRTVSAYFDHLNVVSELGAKPSDLLQSNGVIWVEGPSDRIYVNRWINLFSDGKLQEGRDYCCAFYGGSLLARTQFTSPEEAEAELVNLFLLNPNIVVVCDGDRTSPTGDGSELKPRVSRIKSEVSKIPGAHIWVTSGREIENYVPGEVLAKVFKCDKLPDPEQYEDFFPKNSGQKPSYLEKFLELKGTDKMDLAAQAIHHMTKNGMSSRFDLAENIDQIVNRIRKWNV